MDAYGGNDRLSALPYELIFGVIRHLDSPRNVSNMSIVAQRFRAPCRDRGLWRMLYHRRYGPADGVLLEALHGDWRRLYYVECVCVNRSTAMVAAVNGNARAADYAPRVSRWRQYESGSLGPFRTAFLAPAKAAHGATPQRRVRLFVDLRAHKAPALCM